MKTFEQILQDELYIKREEQWKHCIDWLEMRPYRHDCELYNKEPCPMRCSMAMKKVKTPLYVNENIQLK